MNKNNPQLFISYKSDNVKFIRSFAELLMSEGIHVWMDEYGVKHDQQENFQLFINQALDSCNWAVLFITELFAESPYCLMEVERLLRKHPSNIIIIILEESDKFKLLYPKLYSKGIKIDFNLNKIIKKLYEIGAIPKITKPIKPSDEKNKVSSLNFMVTYKKLEGSFRLSLYFY